MVCGVWCVVRDAHLLVLSTDMQASLETAVAAAVMVPTFLSVVWCGEAFPRLGIHDIKEFDSH
jgi:hypothetical protein